MGQLTFFAALMLCLTSWTTVSAQEEPVNADELPVAFVVDVPLPIVGERDSVVVRQLEAVRAKKQSERPTVILRFAGQATGGSDVNSTARGSQFERCLALARDLIDQVAHVRLIAYIPESVEGHAVLPILACEEMVMRRDVHIGAAGIDEPADKWIGNSYRSLVDQRGLLPAAIVTTMLRPDAVAVEVLESGELTPRVVDQTELKALRDEGKVESEQTIWDGGALATFTGQAMKNRSWILGVADDSIELSKLLNVNTNLRTVDQLPRDWQPIQVTLAGKIGPVRVNQIIRGLREQCEEGCNMVLLRLEPCEIAYIQSVRLAEFLASQSGESVYTLATVSGDVRGAVCLTLAACQETVLIGNATIGPDEDSSSPESDSVIHRSLDDLVRQSGRPLPLAAALASSEIKVKEYIQQETGEKAIFTDWQVEQQAKGDLWQVKRTVAGGEPIETELAVRYGLIDSVDTSPEAAFARLGLEQPPQELKMSWIDALTQTLVAQRWLPRVLMMVGFFALMAELSSPGMGIGGFLSALSFVGFFWLEGLNGNVEALEVILFVFGLIAVLLEIFVIPGFGVFGVGGLLMLLVSVVLASQTFVLPTNSAQLSEVAVNLFWVACLALGGMIGLLFMHRRIEQSPLLRWVTLEPPGDQITGDPAQVSAQRQHLYGQCGITTTRLNPSGKAQFGGDIVSVVGTGKMIGEGIPVRVVEVRGPLILVEEMEA
ncbi:MAG: NfeD family protein [Aureliella sp.]